MHDDHSACPRRLDRRGFLRDTALAIAAALTAQGLAPTAAFAEHLGYIEPMSATGVERAYAFPVTDGVWVDDAQKMVLTRSRGRVYAFSLECPHKGRLLEWHGDEGRFYCPKHKARFTADGAHASGRKTPDLDRFALRREGARVVILFDKVLTVDDTPGPWAAAVLAA